MTTESVDSSVAVRDAERTRNRRLLLMGTAVLLAAVDLVCKVAAEGQLGGGRSVSLGVLDLRLAYNSGAAFSMGAGLPSWAVISVTGAITAGVAAFAWRSTSTGSRAMVTGLAAVVAGAAGNLIDRAGDGAVTDYLYTGWWPTFNLADVLITGGFVVAAVAATRSETSQRG